MTPSRHCCSTDGDVFARRADVTTDGEMRAKRIEAAEPKAGHRAPPMRAPHTPATAVDCYEVHNPSMRVAACPQRVLQSAQERPPRRRFGGLACSAVVAGSRPAVIGPMEDVCSAPSRALAQQQLGEDIAGAHGSVSCGGVQLGTGRGAAQRQDIDLERDTTDKSLRRLVQYRTASARIRRLARRPRPDSQIRTASRTSIARDSHVINPTEYNTLGFADAQRHRDSQIRNAGTLKECDRA